ncbi:MAG: putative porin [Terriglobales bacterium]
MKTARKAGCVLMLVLALAITTLSAASKKTTKPETVSAEDVQALRELIEAQRQELRQLREDVRQMQSQQQQNAEAMRVAAEAQEKASAAQTVAGQQQESVSKLASDVEDIKTNMTNAALSTQDDQKRVGALEGLVNRFRFTGDVRVRYENFFQGDFIGAIDPVEGAVLSNPAPRHRPRIRLRLGVQGKLNEDFSGGLFLASGSLDKNPTFADPVSTNETLTSFFERKVVGFDRGWITYNPQSHKWLELTGGKFAYTWARTVMTFDNDLNPEGFSERASFNLKNTVLKNVNFTGMQLFFNESSGGFDSFAAGGQVGGRLQVGKRLTIAPSYTLLNWRNADSIAQNASPLGGATRIINANAMTNATRNCGGAPGVAEADCRAPNSTTPLALNNTREFVSKFLYSDFIVEANITTPWARWPVRVLGEFLTNLNAENKDPLAIGKQDNGYWAEVTVGQTRNKNDLQFSYTFAHVEQDALISQFSESDMRAPTNVVQHRLTAAWRVRPNLTANYTFWLGRTLNCSLENAALASGPLQPNAVNGNPITLIGNLNRTYTCNGGPTNPNNEPEPLLKRMQFDLIYSF